MVMMLLQGVPQCTLVEKAPYVPLVVSAAQRVALEPTGRIVVQGGQVYFCRCRRSLN
jgi:hypothetical protein